MPSHTMREAAERTSGLALWAGALFVLFAIVAFALDQGPDTSSARSILAHFADAGSAIQWQTLLYGAAAVALLFFASGVGARIQANDIADGHLLAFLLVSASAALVVFQLAGQAAWLTLTRQSSVDLRRGLQEAWLYHDLADSFFIMGNFAAIGIVAVFSLASSRGALPRWTGRLGWALLAVLVVNAVIQVLANSSGEVLGPVAGALFILWVAVVVVLLVVESRKPTPPQVSR
jgi:hypothetical protein